VAEEAGVTLAAHPDDPPMPTVRGQPRLVYQPHLYQKLLDLKPSPRNALEFCLGTIAEMTEGDVYEAVDTYSRQGNWPMSISAMCAARSPLPETFIDEGDVDMLRVLRILRRTATTAC
jgi:mannonate dehydratase